MSAAPPSPPPAPFTDRSARAARFFARLDRYQTLFLRRGWVLILCAALGVGGGFGWLRYTPVHYASVGRMMVNIKLSIPEGSVYTEELGNFLGTQAALMQSGIVVNRASARLAALRPDSPARPVELKVAVSPKTTIFVLRATGDDPDYTQNFLQMCMEEYARLKREMRTQTSDTTLVGLTEEIERLTRDLRKADEELVAFQSTNSVVLLQEQGNSAGVHLAMLNRQVSTLKSELQLLEALTLEQNLERQQRARNASPSDDPGADTVARIGSYGTDPDYFRAKQQIVLLKAQQQELAQYLRPKHPKMVVLAEDIAQRERVLNLFRQETLDQLAGRKNSITKQLENLERDVREWEDKALDISKKTAEFQRIKSAAQRIQALYDRLLATMQTLDVNKDLSPESVISIEKASRAVPDQPRLLKVLIVGALAGFAFGLALLLFVDHLDDRINGLTELTAMFDEPVVGQIPRVKCGRKGQLAIVRPDDDRHAFVEAYRNLRSSLLFMSPAERRPKSILVTSSIPNDGKSLTAANLAVSLAAAGSRVMLVDGDLRKGILHTRFALQPEPGLYEVLAEGADMTQAVRPTSETNLFLLPRGRSTGRSSELFLGQSTRQFLAQAATQYDFVILDTAPVMAADDVTSLAPYLDGVLFVIRARHTSARVARASLDLLARRNVRLLGLVFNAVTSTSGDYYYYRYKDYYKTYPTA